VAVSNLTATTLVAVPTWRRPERLRHLLDALSRIEGLGDVALLVAENDAAERAGERVAKAAAAAGYPMPIDVIIVAQSGLAHVRNAIVARALEHESMRRLAMIDDDEWPEPQWLVELLRVQRETGAAVVGGPVIPSFAEGSPKWVDQTLVFRPEERPEGMADMLYASNNLLVTREALQTLDRPWFDPSFNRSGGEDLDFLTRLKARGRTFAWAPAARVQEWVGPERARRSWVLRRMWRIGVTDTMVARKRRGRALLSLRSLALLALRTLALPSLLWNGRRLDVAGQWVKAVARLYALMGGSDAIYAAPAAKP